MLPLALALTLSLAGMAPLVRAAEPSAGPSEGATLAVASSAPPEAPEAPVAAVAYVPVLRFWSERREVTLEEVRAAVEGRHPRFRSVLVAGPDPAPLWAVLDVAAAQSTRPASYREIVRSVGASKRVLGLVPAAAVTPRLRALRVDGRSLFGRGRVRGLAEWPLRATGSVGPGSFHPAATWTLMAGGDVMLGRIRPHHLAEVLLGRRRQRHPNRGDGAARCAPRPHVIRGPHGRQP
jgi:hypothetical protein